MTDFPTFRGTQRQLKFSSEEAAAIARAERSAGYRPEAPHTPGLGTLALEVLQGLGAEVAAVGHGLQRFFRMIAIAYAIAIIIAVLIGVIDYRQSHTTAPQTEKQTQTRVEASLVPPEIHAEPHVPEGNGYATQSEPPSSAQEQPAEQDSAAGKTESVPPRERPTTARTEPSENNPEETALAKPTREEARTEELTHESQPEPEDARTSELELSKHDLEVARSFLARPPWSEVRAETVTAVFSGPQLDSRIVRRLPPGRIYFVVDTGNGCNRAAGLTWRQVRIPDRGYAYYHNSLAGFVCTPARSRW